MSKTEVNITRTGKLGSYRVATQAGGGSFATFPPLMSSTKQLHGCPQYHEWKGKQKRAYSVTFTTIPLAPILAKEMALAADLTGWKGVEAIVSAISEAACCYEWEGTAKLGPSLTASPAHHTRLIP